MKALGVGLISLEELKAMGVEVTICRPAKAKGVRKQVCRSKGVSAFIRGGAKPIGYTKMAFGSS